MSKAPIFIVEGPPDRRRRGMPNRIARQIGGPTDGYAPIEIEDYDGYGCEGAGHYIGTSLPPGRYKIIRVSAPPEEKCGHWGCIMPRGHNRGKADIPANHKSARKVWR